MVPTLDGKSTAAPPDPLLQASGFFSLAAACRRKGCKRSIPDATATPFWTPEPPPGLQNPPDRTLRADSGRQDEDSRPRNVDPGPRNEQIGLRDERFGLLDAHPGVRSERPGVPNEDSGVRNQRPGVREPRSRSRSVVSVGKSLTGPPWEDRRSSGNRWRGAATGAAPCALDGRPSALPGSADRWPER